MANFSKSLSKEVAQHNIRVNTVSPGPVSTSLWLGEDGVAQTVARATGGDPAAVASQAAADAATGRFTTPEEVADPARLPGQRPGRQRDRGGFHHRRRSDQDALIGGRGSPASSPGWSLGPARPQILDQQPERKARTCRHFSPRSARPWCPVGTTASDHCRRCWSAMTVVTGLEIDAFSLPPPGPRLRGQHDGQSSSSWASPSPWAAPTSPSRPRSRGIGLVRGGLGGGGPDRPALRPSPGPSRRRGDRHPGPTADRGDGSRPIVGLLTRSVPGCAAR